MKLALLNVSWNISETFNFMKDNLKKKNYFEAKEYRETVWEVKCILNILFEYYIM